MSSAASPGSNLSDGDAGAGASSSISRITVRTNTVMLSNAQKKVKMREEVIYVEIFRRVLNELPSDLVKIARIQACNKAS